MRDSNGIYERRAEQEQMLMFHVQPELLGLFEDITPEEREILSNPEEYPSLYKTLVAKLQFQAIRRA